METERFVHRTYVHELRVAGPAPRFFASVLLLLASLAFAALAAVGWSGEAPAWISASPLPAGVRWLLLGIGAVHALYLAILASEQGQRGWTLLAHRAGAFPVLESVGPSRLVQAGSVWGLHVGIAENPLWSELPRVATPGGLFFALEEADVAELSRLFDPGDEVCVQWIDLPPSAGGPTLLAVRTAAREERVLDAPPSLDLDELRRAA